MSEVGYSEVYQDKMMGEPSDNGNDFYSPSCSPEPDEPGDVGALGGAAEPEVEDLLGDMEIDQPGPPEEDEEDLEMGAHPGYPDTPQVPPTDLAPTLDSLCVAVQHMTGAVETMRQRMDSPSGPLLRIRPELGNPASGGLDTGNSLESTASSTFNARNVTTFAPVRHQVGDSGGQTVTTDSVFADARGGRPMAPSRGNILGLPGTRGGNAVSLGGNPRRQVREYSLPESDGDLSVADLLGEMTRSASAAVARDAAVLLELWSKGAKPKHNVTLHQSQGADF